MINYDIIKRILKIALPAVGEMMLYMLIWVVDTMMVGNYGGEIAVSAVGLSSEIFYTITNLLVGMGLGIGMTSLISRAIGARDIERGKSFAVLGIKLTFIIGVILNIIFYFFATEILLLAKAEGEVLEKGSIYFKICSMMVIFNVLRNAITATFVGCQDTKTPLYAAAVINVVNLVLDYMLIFGKFGVPAMGIAGAAWATLAANLAGFIFIILKIKNLPFKIQLSDFTLRRERDSIMKCEEIEGYEVECSSLEKIKELSDIKRLRELVVLSLPAAFQEGAFSIARLITVVMIMSLGSVEFAANQITVAIESISFMPGYGIAIACSTLVGYSIGENNHQRVKDYLLYSTAIGCIIMGGAALLFYFVPEFLISSFLDNGNSEVISIGAECLRITAFSQIPSAIAMILEGGLKGSGDTKRPFHVVFFCSWFIRLPLITYFIYYRRYDITAAWKIILLHWSIESVIIMVLVYRRYFRSQLKFK